jgi:pilus assembly protein CpaE
MSALTKLLDRGRPAPARALGGFIADEATADALRQAAAGLAIADADIVCCPLADAVRHLGRMPTPTTLVIDLSGAGDPLAGLAPLAEVCDEDTHVIAVGAVNDITLYRTLIGLGLQDYLVKPVTAADFTAALQRAGRSAAADTDAAKSGRISAVVGARGGVGATSVAINLAWLLAHEHKRRVALVDLDLFFGTCGLALDLDLGRGFREALENPARIDGLFIERAMIRESDNLFVLSGEEALDYSISYDPSAIELLTDHLRRDFQHVVVDLPRFASRTQISMLTAPASLLIVADPSLSSMRDTQRLLTFTKKAAPSSEIIIALNKVGAHKAAELARGDFEKGIEAKVDVLIPDDGKAFAACVGSGKALPKVANASKAARALRQLAASALAPAGGSGQAASVLSRLFGARR